MNQIDLNGQVAVLRDCLSWLSPQVGLVSGAVPEQVASVRIELAGRPALVGLLDGDVPAVVDQPLEEECDSVEHRDPDPAAPSVASS